MAERITGQIDYYNAGRHSGFLRRYSDGQEFLVNATHLLCAEDTLVAGQAVSFLAGPAQDDAQSGSTKRRPSAHAVDVIDSLGCVLSFDSSSGQGQVVDRKGERYAFRSEDLKCNTVNLYPNDLIMFRLTSSEKGPQAVIVSYHQRNSVAAASQHLPLPEVQPRMIREWIERARTNKYLRNRTFVYVLQAEYPGDQHLAVAGYCYKIGYSEDPHRRRKEIQQGMDERIGEACVILTDNGPSAEQLLHIYFEEKQCRHGRGFEWFHLTESDVQWLKTIGKIDGKRLELAVMSDLGVEAGYRLLQGRNPATVQYLDANDPEARLIARRKSNKRTKKSWSYRTLDEMVPSLEISFGSTGGFEIAFVRSGGATTSGLLEWREVWDGRIELLGGPSRGTSGVPQWVTGKLLAIRSFWHHGGLSLARLSDGKQDLREAYPLDTDHTTLPGMQVWQDEAAVYLWFCRCQRLPRPDWKRLDVADWDLAIWYTALITAKTKFSKSGESPSFYDSGDADVLIRGLRIGRTTLPSQPGFGPPWHNVYFHYAEFTY